MNLLVWSFSAIKDAFNTQRIGQSVTAYVTNFFWKLCLPELISPDLFLFYLQSLEEIEDYCQENLVPHIVMLKDIETGTLRVRSWEKERLVLAETYKNYFTFF
jgi:hypothetical protein